MAIKFNVDPYYDDFLKAGTDTLTPQEKYHKVLFRPGIAVQARELTQLQSILQNQVTQFGSHMFKEGSLVIPGGNAYNNQADYVKLSTVSSTVTSAMEGKHFADATGLRAKVIKAVAAEGSDLDTFYVVYQNSNGATNANKVFAANAALTEKVWNRIYKCLMTAVLLRPLLLTAAATGKGALVQIERRYLLYFRGHFVIVKADTISSF